MEKVVELLVGIPCSGKSTYREKEYDHDKIFVISSDDIKEKYVKNTGVDYLELYTKPKEGETYHPIFGEKTESGNWFLIEEINKNISKDFNKMIRMSMTALNEGKKVVVDLTNLNKKDRKSVQNWYKDEENVKFNAVVFEFEDNFELIKKQNRKRAQHENKTIPDYVLDNMRKKYMPIDLDEKISKIQFIDGLKDLKTELKQEKKIKNNSRLKM